MKSALRRLIVCQTGRKEENGGKSRYELQGVECDCFPATEALAWKEGCHQVIQTESRQTVARKVSLTHCFAADNYKVEIVELF